MFIIYVTDNDGLFPYQTREVNNLPANFDESLIQPLLNITSYPDGIEPVSIGAWLVHDVEKLSYISFLDRKAHGKLKFHVKGLQTK